MGRPVVRVAASHHHHHHHRPHSPWQGGPSSPRAAGNALNNSGNAWRPAAARADEHQLTDEASPLEQEGVRAALNAIHGDASPRERRPTSPRMVTSKFSLLPEKSWEVMWQWKHKTGYKDYDNVTTKKIENAFQCGQTMVRVKTGKKGSTPMELFFFDMIQYDPVTGNQRDIRRVGPDSLYEKCGRRWLRWWIRWTQSHNYGHKGSFSQYKERKAELVHGQPRPLKSERECYKERGCFARIATSGLFYVITASMILFNMIWLGIDTQFNDSDTVQASDVSFQVVEYILGTYFLLELVVRYGAFRATHDAFHDLWFVFDFALVIIAAIELVAFPMLDKLVFNSQVNKSGERILRFGRLFKIARVGRTGRLLRVFPEIMVQLKAMLFAMKTVFWTLMLLLMLLYVFGIVCTNLAADNDALHDDFGTLQYSGWSLMMQGVFLDSPTTLLNRVVLEDRILCGVFIIFICLCSFMVLNMFIGILCTVVEEVSSAEKEEQAVFYLKTALSDILECHDEKGNQTLRKSEFELLMKNPEMHVILTRFGVDVNDLQLMTDTLFEEHDFDVGNQRSSFTDHMTGSITGSEMPGDDSAMDLKDATMAIYNKRERELSWGEFFAVIMRLRGSNSAKVTDIVDLREYVTGGMFRQREYFSQRLEQLEGQLTMLGLERSHCVQTFKLDSPDAAATGGIAPVVSSKDTPNAGQLEVLLAKLSEISSSQQQIIRRQHEVEEEVRTWQSELGSRQQGLGRQMKEVSDQLNGLRRTFGDLSSDDSADMNRPTEVDAFSPVAPVQKMGAKARSSRTDESPQAQRMPTSIISSSNDLSMPGVPSSLPLTDD
mmetsp:Transcript_46989/g.105379  ORF Transcript_46989/g.105379 Transcript_46989/m.105379 type:complete len:831 (-) Transcript_46989:146-2638(-)